jgi:Tol biopolymer transport system component
LSNFILFSVPGTSTGSDLWWLSLTGDTKPVKLLATPSEEMHGTFSPEGTLVAYTSDKSGKFDVYVTTFPRAGREFPVSTGGGYEPRWNKDGSEIYYLSEDRHLMAVTVGKDSNGPKLGNSNSLFQTSVPAGVTQNRLHYVVSSDGRFLINTETRDQSPTALRVETNWADKLKK